MRKLFTIVLAIILAMGLTTSAFALDSPQTVQELEGGEKTVEIGVTGSYAGTDSKKEVYSVDVEWGAMQFQYKTGGSSEWNPETHKYETHTGEPVWTANGNTVTVTNHSSLPVKVAFEFVKNTEMSGEACDGTITVNGGTDIEDEIGWKQLARAEEATGETTTEGPQLTATLVMGNELSAPTGSTTDINLGTLVVKLNKVD